MTFDSFPGYPPFLDAAAAELSCAEAAGPARRVSTLTALANLCAQAAVADQEAVPGILAKAEEFYDQLRVATRAAELMLDSIRATRGVHEQKAPTERPLGSQGHSAGVTGRGPTTSRPNSQRPVKGRSNS